MKRKITLMLVMMLIGLQLIGCSNEKAENTKEDTAVEATETEKLYFKDFAVEGNVVLGDYKNLEVVSNVVTITDEDVDTYINYLLSMSPEKKEVTDRDVVENGDVVNIDYVGKKDDVAFDGGTASGYDLGIGSGSFIPGFEEGLIGVKKGETVDLNLSFPENYHAADLAGAEVVFTVTVNAIYEEVAPELNDAYVAGLQLENVSTTEDYRAYIRNMMEEGEKEYALKDVQTQLITMVTEAATVENLPQELIDKFYDVYINDMTYNAMMYGMDLESFVAANGMEYDAFLEDATAAAEISAKQLFVCLAIAQEENIVITDEELEQKIEENYAGYGYANVEDFKAAVDMEEYKDSLLFDKVVDFLQENATITEVPELAE